MSMSATPVVTEDAICKSCAVDADGYRWEIVAISAEKATAPMGGGVGFWYVIVKGMDGAYAQALEGTGLLHYSYVDEKLRPPSMKGDRANENLNNRLNAITTAIGVMLGREVALVTT